MKKLLCPIILLFSFIRSEAQSDHICPHEKLYVHTDRANYERGDTVRFRAYLDGYPPRGNGLQPLRLCRTAG